MPEIEGLLKVVLFKFSA